MDPKIFSCHKNKMGHSYRFPWRNFVHLLQSHAERRENHPAIIFRDVDRNTREVISYGQLDNQTARLARNLHHEYGIGPGDAVALCLPNCPEVSLLTLALFRLGATSVPLDQKRDVPERKRYKLADSNAKLLCVLPEDLQSESEIVTETKIVSTEQLLTGRSGSSADLEPEWSGDFESEQANCVVLYTSGTTGHPKGALLTRQSITSNADGIAKWLGFDESEKLSLVLPLHHVNSTVFSITILMLGATVILNSRYSAGNFWPVVSEEKATASSIVPTIMKDLLSRWEDFSTLGLDISSLRKIMIGSAPVPAGAACRFYDLFGVRLVQGYGTTEVSLRVTGVPHNLPEEEYRTALSENAAGVELCNCNVKIEGDPPQGELGEILVRGPVVSGGYLNLQKETDEVFNSGWFKTGDIGFWRELAGSKFFFIHGRKKEILIKGGVNISPIAVENALTEATPSLSAAYVVGLEDPRWGEDICAALVFKNGLSSVERSSAAEILVTSGQAGDIPGLSAYEAPVKAIPFQLDQLPMTSTGKVQRSKLREIVKTMVESGQV
jgi:long-chain acyl-CoA synthetase